MGFFDNFLGKTVKLEISNLDGEKALSTTAGAVIYYWNTELRYNKNKYPRNKLMVPDIVYRFLGHKYNKKIIENSSFYQLLPPIISLDQLIAYTTDLIVKEYGIKHSLITSEIEKIVDKEAKSMDIKLNYYDK